MGDKKHIDRLFQERFKDFEVAPSDAVWKHIEAQLDKKKKKQRIIPIWWRYAGIAALLILLLTVGLAYFNQDNAIPENQVVDTEEIPLINNEDSNTPNNFDGSEGIANDSESISDKEGIKRETPLQPSNNTTPLSESAIAEIAPPNNKDNHIASPSVSSAKNKTVIADHVKKRRSQGHRSFNHDRQSQRHF